ncbi:Protein MKS1, partial [Mucuna pruriens]
MNSQDIPSERSPKRELQGPRPTPLRINKDSHKIKKPPVAPPPAQPQAPPRQPVIIYTVSPKVIHTTPSDFMSLVQRLTGSSSSSFPPSNKASTNSLNDNNSRGGENNDDGSNNRGNNNSGNHSNTTVQYAAIEMARTSQSIKQRPSENSGDVGWIDGVNHVVIEQPRMFHGILSPGPASLSPIPSNFFSPPSTDPNMLVDTSTLHIHSSLILVIYSSCTCLVAIFKR